MVHLKIDGQMLEHHQDKHILLAKGGQKSDPSRKQNFQLSIETHFLAPPGNLVQQFILQRLNDRAIPLGIRV